MIMLLGWRNHGRSVRRVMNVLSSMYSQRVKNFWRCQELVQQDLSKSHAQQNWYDKKFHVCAFRVGDPIHVLLPTLTSKLLVQLQEPYQITKRTGRVTYMVDMCNHKKRWRVFHVNMLKEFQVHRAIESSYFTDDIECESDEMLLWQGSTLQDQTDWRTPNWGTGSTVQQILKEFNKVLQNQPG